MKNEKNRKGKKQSEWGKGKNEEEKGRFEFAV
jgi:hypothetical protein